MLFPRPITGPSAVSASALSERDAALTELAKQVALAVTQDTGWPIDTSRLRVEALSGYACLDRIDTDSARRAGVVERKATLEKTAPRRARDLVCDLHPTIARSGTVSARLQDGLRHASSLATYLASEETVIVNEEALRKLSRAGVAHLLYHELFHAAQNQNFPELMYEQIVQPLTDARRTGSRDAELDAQDTVQARMTLAESHARCVDIAAYVARYPDSNLPYFRLPPAHALLRRNMAKTERGQEFEAKGAQYTAHSVIAGLLGRPDGAFLIRQIYADPRLADLLFKRRGTITFERDDRARPFGDRGLIEVVRLLRDANPYPDARQNVRVVIQGPAECTAPP